MHGKLTGIIALGAAGLLAAAPTPAAAVTVSPHDLGDVAITTAATGKASFAAVPSEPFGAGALSLSTGAGTPKEGSSPAAGGRAEVGLPAFAEKRLTQNTFTDLSYRTFTAQDTVLRPALRIPFKFASDADGLKNFGACSMQHKAPCSSSGTLVYEPVYNPIQGSPTRGVWQTWTAADSDRAGLGRWYSTMNLVGLVSGDAQAKPLRDIIADNPGLVIGAGGLSLAAGENGFGSSWANWTGFVDGLTVGQASQPPVTYDFERRLPALSSQTLRSSTLTDVGLVPTSRAGSSHRVGSFGGEEGLLLFLGNGDGILGGRETVAVPSPAGTLLTSLTQLGYRSFSSSGTTAGDAVAPALRVQVTGLSGDEKTSTLVYEPIYDPSARLAQDRWQDWNALEGRWWSTRAIEGVCKIECWVEWQDILVAHPDARVGAEGVAFDAGQNSSGAPWQGFKGGIDKLTVGIDQAVRVFDIASPEPAREDTGTPPKTETDTATPAPTSPGAEAQTQGSSEEPAAQPAQTVRINRLARSVRARRGKFTAPLVIVCPASQRGCVVKLAIMSGGRRIGAAEAPVSGGQTVSPVVTLNASGRRLLRRRSVLNVLLRVQVGTLQADVRRTYRLTLRRG